MISNEFWFNFIDKMISEEIDKFIKLVTSMIDFNIEDELNNIKCKTFVIGSHND